ncbi:RNA methyltransferase [Pyrenophora tritici-repentis]|nr:RNA methyltransferase [Pyrenophora tritici-repentis]KAI0606306.1 RNA methyltransferase [Pyrenophora tritici-repentis]KAI0618445.1 RNA methyltransferase [Pyrenophora tritici-repentis]KAI1674177.1 SpoU rRNA Methylase protein [Pyrenophora tritici-repentis]KAI1688720.1 SpoU rRNA Methylase protein [Pyrenophora tritici-repentis]
MVYFCLGGNTLRHVQQSILPRTFCRYKSITAAIERGRHDGRDRPFRPRTQTANYDNRESPLKTRREARFERFGPPRDDPFPKPNNQRSSRNKEERPPNDNNDALSSFVEERPQGGRARLSRAGNSRPSRFDEDRPSRKPYGESSKFGRGRPSGKWQDRPARAGSDLSNRHGEDRPRGNWKERSQSDREDRPARVRDGGSNRFGRDGPQRNWEERSPSNREGRPAWAKSDGFDRSRGEGFQKTSNDRSGRLGVEKPQRISEEQAQETSVKQPVKEDTRPEFVQHLENLRSPSARTKHNKLNKHGLLYVVKPDSGEGDSTRFDKPKSVRGPESLPYTTAASEFIYGTRSVLAAIKANRRKFYKLYIHARGMENSQAIKSTIRSLKLFHITTEVGDEYMRAMDKASNGRPHNGLILEASPPPVLPITQLTAASIEDGAFNLSLDRQSAEDEAINGTQELYEYKSDGWRYPLILYIDGVVDEGNLGAIARSAYVLGVDAIVTPTHHTAEWSPIAIKASSGAAEAMPLFRVKEPEQFFQSSSQVGWRIYASDAVPLSTQDGQHVVYSLSQRYSPLPADHSPLAEHPTILMMGSEHSGVKKHLAKMAHYKVGIPHGRSVDEVGVDSFNVSVAAGILCYQMMQRPQSAAERDPENVMF